MKQADLLPEEHNSTSSHTISSNRTRWTFSQLENASDPPTGRPPSPAPPDTHLAPRVLRSPSPQFTQRGGYKQGEQSLYTLAPLNIYKIVEDGEAGKKPKIVEDGEAGKKPKNCAGGEDMNLRELFFFLKREKWETRPLKLLQDDYVEAKGEGGGKPGRNTGEALCITGLRRTV